MAVSYSEVFLKENDGRASVANAALYRGDLNVINKVVDNKVKLLDTDPNKINFNEDDGLLSLVFDHYVCKRIINNKRDRGINLYLQRIIDISYSNRQIYLLGLFLPFNLGLEKIKNYLDTEHLQKYNEIIRQKEIFENKIGNIVKIVNGRVYFDNGKDVSEDSFLKFLIVNIPTDNPKITKLQDNYFVEKMRILLSDVKVVDDNIVLANGSIASPYNLGISNLLIQFIIKYGFYEELGDNRYYEVGSDKSLIRDDVGINVSAYFSDDGYAYYCHGERTGNFSMDNILQENIDILFFLKAITHEARHCVQYNCKKSLTRSVWNAHLDSIMTNLTWGDYFLNYHSQTIEHDANRKACFIIKRLMRRIGRNDLADYINKEYENKILDLLFEIRKDKDGNTHNIWEYEGEFIDELSIYDLDTYPELGFLFNREDNQVVPLRLVELFNKYDLHLRGCRLFENSFIANYIRYRILNNNELEEVISYMLSNNVPLDSKMYNNVYGYLWNLVDEGQILSNNVVKIIKTWKKNTGFDKNSNTVVLINPFFSRMETQLQILDKIKLLSPKYPGIEKGINYAIENIYGMLKNLMHYYEELKVSINSSNIDYIFILKKQYHILLFLNKFESLSSKYLDNGLTSNVLMFKADVISNFDNIVNRIQNDNSLTAEQKNKYLTICSRHQGVSDIDNTEEFISEVFKPLK